MQLGQIMTELDEQLLELKRAHTDQDNDKHTPVAFKFELPKPFQPIEIQVSPVRASNFMTPAIRATRLAESIHFMAQSLRPDQVPTPIADDDISEIWSEADETPEVTTVDAATSPIKEKAEPKPTLHNACVGTVPTYGVDKAVGETVRTATVAVGTPKTSTITRGTNPMPVTMQTVGLSPMPLPTPARTPAHRPHASLVQLEGKENSPQCQATPLPTPIKGTPLALMSPADVLPAGAWDDTPQLHEQLRAQKKVDSTSIFPTKFAVPRHVSDLFGGKERSLRRKAASK